MDGKRKSQRRPAARTAPARRGGCLHQPGAAGDRGMVPQGEVRKNLLGGVVEVQMWKKLEELYGLYENAIRAERARYNALLEAHTPPGENHEEGC